MAVNVATLGHDLKTEARIKSPHDGLDRQRHCRALVHELLDPTSDRADYPFHRCSYWNYDGLPNRYLEGLIDQCCWVTVAARPGEQPNLRPACVPEHCGRPKPWNRPRASPAGWRFV